MNGTLTPYEMVVILLLCLWLVPLVTIWVRFESLPHAQELFTATLLVPAILGDEILKAFELHHEAPFMIGVFQFAPVMVAVMLLAAVRKMVLEEPGGRAGLYFIVLLTIGAEVPFLLLPSEVKIEVLENPIVGNLNSNWPIYGFFAGVSFLVLFFAVRVEQAISDYQRYLSDQVVDVHYYEMPITAQVFFAMVTIAFCALITVGLVAFDIMMFPYWMSGINFFYTVIYILLLMVFLEKRSYSPSPLDYDKLNSKKSPYSEEALREALIKTEKAIIRFRAYKRVGLRLRHLANAAEVEPTMLAVAIRHFMNRNFRAFIYHYRLEYAKKVLMSRDVKVKSVAKRLGFTSEKFLSDVFVRYISKGSRSKKKGPPQPATGELKEQL